MILITGASGFLGSNLASEARRRDLAVKALVRTTSDTSTINIEDDHLVYGDITNLDSLVSSMQGCETVIHSAAMISEAAPDEELSQRINVTGTENVIAACKKAGVKRLVHISAHSAKPDNPSVYGRTKLEADNRVQASGLEWTIVKPAVIYGPTSKGLFAKIKNIVNALPVIPVLGPGTEELRPVHVDDLVDLTLKSIKKKDAIGKIYDVGGAEVVTFNKFLETILEAQGKKRKKFVHIPLWMCYAGARFLALFLKNPPVTVDNLDGLQKSKGFGIDEAKTDFGFEPMDIRRGLTKTFNLNGKKYEPGQAPKKRIAIVGLGKMGILHSSMINVIPNAAVAALVDKDLNAGKSLVSMGVNAPLFSDLGDAIKQVELDGVIICAPQFAHRPVAETAIKAGLNVLCEKPLAHTLSDAQKMVELAKQYKVKHSIGYMMGYAATFSTAKEILEGGALGKLAEASATCYLSQVFRPSNMWFYQPEASGGGLVINVTSHLLSALYLLFGELECESASVKKIHSKNVEDQATAVYRSKQGLAVSLETNWSVKGYPLQYCGVHIEGENGTLSVDNDWLTLKLKKDAKGYKKGTTQISVRELEKTPFNLSPDYMGEAYYRQDSEFVAVMGTDKSASFDWEAGLAVQRMIHNLYDKAGATY